MDLNHPLVQYVFSLKLAGPGNRTNLLHGRITNKDAIVLLLCALGHFGLKELREISMAWRGSISMQTYFGPTYGYTGAAFTGSTQYAQGLCSRAHTRGMPLWYRAIASVRGKSRYNNALTGAGMLRLGELYKSLPDSVKPSMTVV
jgi:hypothetical protein